MSRVVHCKKAAYDVYCGRPTRWGNPFAIGKDGDRAEVIRKYKEWLFLHQQTALRQGVGMLVRSRRLPLGRIGRSRCL